MRFPLGDGCGIEGRLFQRDGHGLPAARESTGELPGQLVGTQGGEFGAKQAALEQKSPAVAFEGSAGKFAAAWAEHDIIGFRCGEAGLGGRLGGRCRRCFVTMARTGGEAGRDAMGFQ